MLANTNNLFAANGKQHDGSFQDAAWDILGSRFATFPAADILLAQNLLLPGLDAPLALSWRDCS